MFQDFDEVGWIGGRLEDVSLDTKCGESIDIPIGTSFSTPCPCFLKLGVLVNLRRKSLYICNIAIVINQCGKFKLCV